MESFTEIMKPTNMTNLSSADLFKHKAAVMFVNPILPQKEDKPHLC